MTAILKLDDIEKTLPFNVTQGTSLDNLKNLVHGRYGMELDFDVYLPSKKMNLQRDLVWTDFQKQQIVISVLKGIKLPAVSIVIFRDESLPAGDRHQIYKVIDGKQRMNSLAEFLKGEFFIEWEGCAYAFQDLDKAAQQKLNLLSLTANVAYEYQDDMISDEDKIKWFEMINFSGTVQDENHLAKLKK